MDQIDWVVWVVGLLIGAAITWFFSWKYGSRRRKLLFTWDCVQLMPERKWTEGALEVSFEGLPVDDPYLLKITLKNVGPVDIASADFDAGLPLRVLFSKGYLELLDMNFVDVMTLIGMDEGVLSIDPILLRRGATIFLDVLVDGKPEVELESPLINTDIVDADTAQRSIRILSEVAAGPASVVVGPATSAVVTSIVRRAAASQSRRR
jgi:hypothetical protein